MANISVTFTPDRTLSYTAWTPTGGVRTTITTIPQTGGAGTGYYSVVDGALVSGDIVKVTDSVYGYIGGQEYNQIEAKIDIIDTNVDTLIVGQNKTNNSYVTVTEDERARVIYL